MSRDILFMKEALTLAVRGSASVRPNPLVGALLVKGGRRIAGGYHQNYGGPHAEVDAIRKAGRRAQGADLYVTLEPCCHYGRTPPCTDLIIKNRLRRVFVAMEDPNRKVDCKGIKQLQIAGIIVKSGILRNEARSINRVYLKNLKKMPYTILKMAQTLDGKTATASGDSKWISSPASRELVHTWRADADAIMVGAGTVLKDDPALTAHGKGPNPVRIIIAGDQHIPKSLATGSMIISGMNRNRKIDFKHLMKNLYNKGIYKIIVEGGGTLNSHLLADGVIDEIRFFIAPKILGGKDALTSVDGSGPDRITKAIKIKDMSVTQVGPDLLVKGYL